MKTRFLPLIVLNIFLTACGINAPQQTAARLENTPIRAEVIQVEAEPTLPEAVQVTDAPTLEPVQIEETAPEQTAAQVTVAINDTNVCDASAFIFADAHPTNSDIAAPELSVTCQGDSMIVQSNGIIGYEFVAVTPRGIDAQEFEWEIPLNPEIAAEPTDIPLLGTVAISVNGIPIYGPNEAANLGWGDPVLDEVLDFCNGHTGGNADYHYHARPDCLFEDMEGNTSLVIGYSLDGFPILAPYICEDTACTSIKKVESSWQRTQDVTAAWDAHEYIEGSGDLDQCNGMVLSDGSYAYFATDTFPYFQACYAGTPSASAQVGNNGGQPQGQSEGQPQDNRGNGQRPDFAAAAEQLGVTEQALRDALGGPPPDIDQAAQQLGISADAIREALGPPPQQ